MPCENLPEMGGADFADDYTLLLLLHFEESFFDCEPSVSEGFINFLRQDVYKRQVLHHSRESSYLGVL